MQNAVNSKPQANLEDYNPYGGQTSGQPAVMPAGQPQPQPPAYTPSNQQQVSSKDFEVFFTSNHKHMRFDRFFFVILN